MGSNRQDGERVVTRCINHVKARHGIAIEGELRPNDQFSATCRAVRRIWYVPAAITAYSLASGKARSLTWRVAISPPIRSRLTGSKSDPELIRRIRDDPA